MYCYCLKQSVQCLHKKYTFIIRRTFVWFVDCRQIDGDDNEIASTAAISRRVNDDVKCVCHDSISHLIRSSNLFPLLSPLSTASFWHGYPVAAMGWQAGVTAYQPKADRPPLNFRARKTLWIIRFTRCKLIRLNWRTTWVKCCRDNIFDYSQSSLSTVPRGPIK